MNFSNRKSATGGVTFFESLMMMYGEAASAARPGRPGVQQWLRGGEPRWEQLGGGNSG